jgi:hypothetical protein
MGTRYKHKTNKGKAKANHFRQFLSNEKKKYLSFPIKYTRLAGSPIHIREAIICPNALNMDNTPCPLVPNILANIKNAPNWKR